jgi:hypothetical protein
MPPARPVVDNGTGSERASEKGYGNRWNFGRLIFLAGCALDAFATRGAAPHFGQVTISFPKS